MNIPIEIVALCFTLISGIAGASWYLGRVIGGGLIRVETKLESLKEVFESFRKSTNDRLNSHSERIRDLEKGE